MTQGIDFLITKRQQKVERQRLWRRCLFFSLLVGAMCLFLTLLLFGCSVYWRNLNENVLQRIETQKQTIAGLKNREVQAFLFTNRLAAIASLFRPEKNYFLTDLRYLAGLLLPGTQVSELSWDGQWRFLVSIEADQVVSLAHLLDNLTKAPSASPFNSLSASSVNRLEGGRYNLNLIFSRHENTQP